MSLYNNDKCPVCGKQFAEGDDIVTCPVCGTPHHRECYNSIGKCANEGLHAEGFVFKRASDEEPAAEKDENAATKKPPVIFENLNKDFQGKIEDASPFVRKSPTEEQNASNSAPNFNFNGQTAYVFNKDEKIDDVAVEDVATAVGNNFPKFIDKFRKNKKLNWNWSAFIFGPYYFFFRKMYGQGTLFLAIEFFARMIVSVVYSSQLTKLFKDLMTISQSQNNVDIVNQTTQAMRESGAMPAYWIIMAVILVIHIIIAVTADGFYRKKVISTVKSVDSKIESDGNIMISPLIGVGSDEMNKNELRKLVIASKGGISFFAPCIAYLVMTLIADLTAYL